ncbi:hypothetical protein D9M09_14865 [Janthinobacterium agaricidamnosum]|uniref:Uncharacterized protein n=1 Tax=Janthinobacterium agaricidamnosum TaxID=55508 RepID=A0A3G2E9B7_9BURK|nr:hypothetical protein D9M09_14865 [Janthinobacterium agaricidamnosum]
MNITAAIVEAKGIRLAVVLAPLIEVHPTPNLSLLRRAQNLFPTLPIMLMSPRVGGFSHSYATFKLDEIVKHVNANEIGWRSFTPALTLPPDGTPPF